MTCPTCRLTIATSAAESPFQNCPRCLLRDKLPILMVPSTGPRRFGRSMRDLDRIVEAKSRLTRVPRGVA